MSNYDNLLRACQEELMGIISTKIENKYEDEFEKYMSDNGSKQFFRKIYPEVRRYISAGLKDEEVREDMRQMDYGVNFSKITNSDIEKVADDITWRIVFNLIFAEPFFSKEELGLKAHKTPSPQSKKPFASLEHAYRRML